MTSKQILDTMIDSYITTMNKWDGLHNIANNESISKDSRDAAYRLAMEYHNEAMTIEKLIKQCFGDINVFDMWLDA